MTLSGCVLEAARRRAVNAIGTSTKPNGYVEYTRGPNEGRSVHVVAIEQCIGRRLAPDEVVHHINGDRSDNRVENLQLMTRSEHARHHLMERKGRKDE